MARWSLRTKLVAVAALALLPILLLSGWRAYVDSRAAQARRAEAATTVAEQAAARYRELLEGSRRLLVAACDDDAVRAAVVAEPASADLDRCESYLAGLLQRFPGDYSALLVTDDRGIGRCASTPRARGMTFSDRELFRAVQQSHNFGVGSYVASRLTPSTEVPMGVPILRDGQL